MLCAFVILINFGDFFYIFFSLAVVILVCQLQCIILLIAKATFPIFNYIFKMIIYFCNLFQLYIYNIIKTKHIWMSL